MTRFVLPLFVVALAAVAPAAPIPDAAKAPVLFFPVARASWVYESGRVDTEARTETVEAVLAVTGRRRVEVFGHAGDVAMSATVTDHPGAVAIDLGGERDGRIQPDNRAAIVSGGGLVEATTGFRGHYMVGRTLVRWPVVPGERWAYQVGGRPDPEERSEVRGWEGVTVPAGRFEAVRVDTTHVWWTGRVERVVRAWYAPGVGRVRWEDDQGRRNVLKRFTPGRE